MGDNWERVGTELGASRETDGRGLGESWKSTGRDLRAGRELIAEEHWERARN